MAEVYKRRVLTSPPGEDYLNRELSLGWRLVQVLRLDKKQFLVYFETIVPKNKKVRKWVIQIMRDGTLILFWVL